MPKGSGRPRRYVQVADYCARIAAETGTTPSYRQIGEALRIPYRGTVRRYVVEAEEHGLLSRSGDYTGGHNSASRRIRLGRPDEAERKTIRLGSEMA